MLLICLQDSVLMGESVKNLPNMTKIIWKVFKKKKLNMNVNTSKVDMMKDLDV